VKKAYDQVLEEKFSLEQDIKKLEYSTAQDQSREETAKAETKDTVRRIKELSTEIKQMKATNASNRKESGELKKKVRTLQALADTAEKKTEDALEKLDKESKKSKELETKIEALRLEMRDPREVAEQLDSVRDLTKDYKERAKQHAEDAKKERVRQKQLRQELRTLQKADKANSDVRNKLNTQLARNKKELDKATAKLNEAELKLESEKDRRRELAGQLEFLSESLKENLSEDQLSEKIEGIKTEAILAKDEGANVLASAEQMTRENQDLEKKLDEVRKMSVTDDSRAAETAKEALESVIPTSKIGSSLVVKNLIKESRSRTWPGVSCPSKIHLERNCLVLGKGRKFRWGIPSSKYLKSRTRPARFPAVTTLGKAGRAAAAQSAIVCFNRARRYFLYHAPCLGESRCQFPFWP